MPIKNLAEITEQLAFADSQSLLSDADITPKQGLKWDLVKLKYRQGEWHLEWTEGRIQRHEVTRFPFQRATEIIKQLQGVKA